MEPRTVWPRELGQPCRSRGRASREWPETWRGERQEACGVACANGELLDGPDGGQLVRPCHSCGAPVYWSRDGTDLLDACGSHFRSCGPTHHHADDADVPRECGP